MEIRVTATYEGEDETEFNSLVDDFIAAKAAADLAQKKYQPLIDAAGNEKLRLVYEQIGVLVKRLHVIMDITGQSCQSVDATAYIGNTRHTLDIRVRNDADDVVYIDGNTEPQNWWFDEDGIITNWNKLKLFKSADSKVTMRMKLAIEQQANRKQRVIDNYENMTNN